MGKPSYFSFNVGSLVPGHKIEPGQASDSDVTEGAHEASAMDAEICFLRRLTRQDAPQNCRDCGGCKLTSSRQNWSF